MPEKELLKNEIVQELSSQIRDLVLESHSSKGKEVSNLVINLRKDFQKVSDDIVRLSDDFVKLDNTLTAVQTSITNEMQMKHQAIDFKYEGHERRLTFTEKMLFGTAGLVLTSFVVGLITLVFKQ